jgi:predicted ribosomally synthesized peptide with nif11-like leader
MSTESFATFFQASLKDPTLLETLERATTPEEKVNIINAAGYSVEVADLEAAVVALEGIVNQKQSEDVSDDELASASGGFFLSAVWPDQLGGSKVGQLADDALGLVVKAFAPPASALYDTLNNKF